jgi:hypothetical protein
MLPRALLLIASIVLKSSVLSYISALTACRAPTNAQFDDRSFILFMFFGSQTGAKGVYTPPVLNP